MERLKTDELRRLWCVHALPRQVGGSQHKHQVLGPRQAVHLNQQLSLHPAAAFMLASENTSQLYTRSAAARLVIVTEGSGGLSLCQD